MAYLTPTAPSTTPFTPGETDTVAYQAAPCLPVVHGTATPVVIAANPPPTATAPAGSGIACLEVKIAANPISGLNTDLLIEVQVATSASPGAYTIALTFSGSDGVAIKPRFVTIPVQAVF
jgi:hypothetical protein